MTLVAADLPPQVVELLAGRGFPGATALRALRGPLMSRFAVRLSDGRHLWVDLPTDGEVALGRLSDLPGWLTGHDGVALAQTLTAGSARMYPTPWPARLLADLLTSAEPVDDAIGTGLGRLLRRAHGTRPKVPDALDPRVHPPALARVRAARAAGLAPLSGDAERSLERVLTGWSTWPRTALHGEPASGHVLVPDDGEGATGPPGALLTGWTGAPVGPAWFDVGYLIGDLVEVAHLVSAAARGRVLALAAAVRSGYDGDAPLPAEFWRSARDAAVVKVLDHDARIFTGFGPQPQARPFLAGIAHALRETGPAATALST